MADETNSPQSENKNDSVLSARMPDPGPWKARLVVCLLLLLFSVIGLIFTDISPKSAWNYWRVMVPIFAVLCLWLSWYLRRKNYSTVNFTHTFWQEILHWIALMVAVYLIMLLVDDGLMGRLEAGLVVLILLAFSIFVAGIYIDVSFMWIGIVLGIFVALASFVTAYLSIIMIPVAIIAAVVIFFLIRRAHSKHMSQTS